MNEPRSVGRIRYIEPNYTNSIEMQGPHGLHSYEFANPLEDYCIYVNLKVEVRGREIRTDFSTPTQTFTMNYYAQQGKTSISFNQGTEYPTNSGVYSQTTEYLNHIFIDDIVKTDDNHNPTATTTSTEMFGINSIDIAYNNYVVPEVTIKFTDIRGASLFAAEEGRHNKMKDGISNSVNEDVEGSFFKSFFCFPYPKFTMIVKGYYGQPVSYELSCSDFRASFNSQTGNFEVTAKFLGFAFGFLGDINLGAVTAAPYSDFLGKEYWQKNVDSGRFYVTDINGNKVKMPTIASVVSSVESAMTQAQGVVESSPEAQALQQSQQNADNAEGLTSLFDAYINSINTAVSSFAQKEYGSGFVNMFKLPNNVIFFIPIYVAEDANVVAKFLEFSKKTDDNTLKEALQNQNTTLANSVQQAYNSLSSKTSNYSDDLKKIVDKMNPEIVTKKTAFFSRSDGYDGLVVSQELKNLVANTAYANTANANAQILTNNQKIYKYLSYMFVIPTGNVQDTVGKEKEQAKADIEKAQEAVGEATDKAISDALGFTPSVEAITRIIMAHFETLVYMVGKTAEAIIGQNRTVKTLGISQKNLTDATTSKHDGIIPPFPRVVEHKTEDGVEKDEETWVGNFSGDWLEKDLINGLLNGVNSIAQIMNSEGGGNDNGDNDKAIMKIPLSPLDMIMTKNPYGNMDFNDYSDFVGKVTLRMLQILGTNPYSYTADEAGMCEAENFYTFFPNVPQDKFLINLKVNNPSEIFSQIIRGEADVTAYGSNKAFAWERSCKEKIVDHKKYAFITKHWGYTIYASSNGWILPFQNIDLINIEKKYKLNLNKGYRELEPSSVSDTIFTNSNLYSDATVYITDRINHFSTIVQNQCTSATSFVESMKNEYAFDNSKYTVNLNSNSLVITGVKQSESDSEKSEDASSDTANTADTASTAATTNDSAKLYIADSEWTEHHTTTGVSNCDFTQTDSFTIYANVFGQKEYYSFSTEGKALYLLNDIMQTYCVPYNCIQLLTIGSKNISFIPKVAVLAYGGYLYYDKFKDKDEHLPQTFIYNGYYNNRPNLSENLGVQEKLIKYFQDWVSKDFKTIDQAFSLKVNANDFFKKLASATFDENFVKQELGTATLVYDGIWKNANGGVSLRPKNGTASSKLLTNLIAPVCFVKPTKYFNKPIGVEDGDSIKVDNADAFISSFLKHLGELYGSVTSTTASTDAADIQRAQDCDTDPDIKLGTYKYIKLLYDKWLAGSSYQQEYRMEKFFGENPESTSADDRYFYFIDSFYNRVGNRILINIGKFAEQVKEANMNEGYSLLSFLSALYQQNKFNLIGVQNFMDLSEAEVMKKAFVPVPFVEMDIPDTTPNFLVVYPYEKSSHLDLLGIGDDYSYPDDSFDCAVKDGATTETQAKGTDGVINKWPMPLNSSDDVGYHIPAFGVSYAKQYQSYFTNINVSMDSPMVTDQAIRAQYQIACSNNDTSQNENGQGSATKSMTTMGQDLFTIYSNNSYTCEVDMMGDCWIQPLMYFELLNVPMFHGTYLVEKVSHHIEAGNMTTHFTGVRMANTTNKLKKGWYWMNRNANGGGSADDLEQRQHQAADVTNDCPYEFNPIGGGSLQGTSLSLNGASFIIGGEGWAGGEVGGSAKAIDINDGKAATIGPGLTESVIKGLQPGQAFSAQELKTYFINHMKYLDGRAKTLCPNMFGLDQKCKDIIYRIGWFGEGHLSKFKNCKTAQDVAETFYQRMPGTWTGHYNVRAATYALAAGLKTIDSNHSKGATKDAQHILDKYYSIDPKVQQWLGGATQTNVNQNGKKNKNQQFWDDFISSVQATSQNTPSIQANFGTKHTENSLTGYITQEGTGGKATPDQLAKVFDMILNTYWQYIERLTWVVKSNNDYGGPNELYLIISEKPTANNIKVGMSVKGTGDFIPRCSEKSNQIYRRAIVKFYSVHGGKGGNQYSKYVQTKILDEDWEKLKPTACAEVVGGGGALGTGANIVNGKVGTFDLAKASTALYNYINYAQKNYPHGHAAARGTYYCHRCTGGPNRALSANGETECRGSNPEEITKKLQAHPDKWACIERGVGINVLKYPGKVKPQNGDIGTMWVREGSDERPWHSVIYMDNMWCSDCFQGDRFCPYPLTNKNMPKTKWFLFRHK